MKTQVLRINVNNMRQEIEKDYFRYKDVFYKCLIVNLCIYNSFNNFVLSSTIIDDSHYNQYLLYLANKQASLSELIAEIDPIHAVNTFLDTQVYLEEFVNMKHDANLINLYSLSIDDTYHIVITNKQLKRHHAQ